ncbi:Cyclophilin type peptidyl-prolyl cis-trans isomerase/CLD [uncultured archaeon]|nr:Cyclophilin type peptidyl-prolyl cis-trans isomerase/CLD [uncultured archaeon]
MRNKLRKLRSQNKAVFYIAVGVVALMFLWTAYSVLRNGQHGQSVASQYNYATATTKSLMTTSTTTTILSTMKTTSTQIPQTKTRRAAVLETAKGTITFVLYENEAPVTTKNFIGLVERGFYRNMVFHRVVPGFVIQTGDPTGTGRGGSDATIPLEISKALTHVKGAVGMARSNDPDSASSQFYITLDDTHQLDGGYAVFGKVVSGMDVVESIKQGDTLISVRLINYTGDT